MEDMVGAWGRGEKKLEAVPIFSYISSLVLGHRNGIHESAPKSKNSLIICPRLVDTNFIINNNESSPGK